MERWIAFGGIFAMMFFAWLMSSHKRKVDLRVVIGGVLLQIVLALLILKTDNGRAFFDAIGLFFQHILDFVDAGSAFVFDIHPRDKAEAADFPPTYTLWRSFAFGILPTIVFFSSLMSIMYHLGIMQWIVAGCAFVMQKTLGTSGAETLSAAANIFVGQTEAPLVVRPYVKNMTMSELNVVMVGGFATIAGGVLAAFVGMGINPGHLITASVISAPAALVIAKILQPETETPETANVLGSSQATTYVNVVEAAAEGATAGMKLALNVAAMLIAFMALVAMADAIIHWIGVLVATNTNLASAENWSLHLVLGYLFYPFAWLMGIPKDECLVAGQFLGTKMAVTEFVAYLELAAAKDQLSERTFVILTYALCGFANFASIGIQLGGIGGIAPDRRADLAKLGFRAMLGGTLAAFMTACIAGVLL